MKKSIRFFVIILQITQYSIRVLTIVIGYTVCNVNFNIHNSFINNIWLMSGESILVCVHRLRANQTNA